MSIWKKCLSRKNHNGWEPRVNFEDPKQGDFSRAAMEKEAKQDLQKPIWQLVCDVHEEANHQGRPVDQNLIHATKRMVSMMGRVALEHERSHRTLVRLTWVLTGLTVLLVLDFILKFKGWLSGLI